MTINLGVGSGSIGGGDYLIRGGKVKEELIWDGRVVAIAGLINHI